MTVTLYVNTADTRTANKAPYLSTLATLSCRPTNACSVIQPSIILDWKAMYNNANYAYIADFNKYYFITDKVLDSGNQCLLQMDADDRFNWYDYYKNKTAIITRSEKIGAPTAIVDSKLPINPNRHELLTLPILKNGAAAFASDLATCKVVLTTIGNVKQNPLSE